MDEVRLPDLEVIRRYSIAVRTEHAPRAEVIEALRADLEALTGSARTAKPAAKPAPRASKPATRSTTRRR